jgi:hypothetical protein
MLPPPSALHPEIPPQVDHLVLRALAKDQGLWQQDATDFRRRNRSRAHRQPATSTPAGATQQVGNGQIGRAHV